MRHVLPFVGAALVLGAAAGCLEPDPVEFELPPWAIEKELLNPGYEWWFQRTVVETPIDQAATFVGDGDLSDRVKFRITENILYVDRSYPMVFSEDANTEAINDIDQPLAAYPILQHFDVINGQVFDPPGRLWWEKPWMRVDWGNNLVRQHRFINFFSNEDGVRHWIQQPDDENHPILLRRGENADYFDFTTVTLLTADLSIDPFSKQVQPCGQIVELDYLNCAAVSVKYRNSFRRVPQRHDYVPVVEGDDETPGRWGRNRFFNSTLARYQEGFLGREDRVRNLVTVQFWTDALDDEGNPRPYHQRTVKPIVLYLNADWPADYIPAVQGAVDQWNEVLRDVAAEASYHSCVDAGESGCDRDAFRPEVGMQLCPNNPVKAGDPALCGEPDLKVRLGDARYHLLYWSTTSIINQSGALAWFSVDPSTGESFNAHVTFSSTAMGEILSYFDDVMDFAVAVDAPDEVEFFSASAYQQLIRPPMSFFEPFAGKAFPALGSGMVPADLPILIDTADGEASPAVTLANRERAFSALDKDDLLWALSDPEDVAPLLMDGVVTEVTPELLAEYLPTKRPYRAAGNIDYEAQAYFEDRGLDSYFPPELDLSYLSKVDDVEAFKEQLAIDTVRGFVAHEIGHVLGMRHNFAGSIDALNYHPEYWDLRLSNDSCTPPDGLPGQGPHYLPGCEVTQEQIDGEMYEYTYSTLMDYMPRIQTASKGLGYYDKAAIFAVYGGLTEVFDDPDLLTGPDGELAAQLLQRLRRLRINYMPVLQTVDGGTVNIQGVHYTQYPAMLGDLSRRAFVPANRVGANGVTDDGRPAVPYRSCRDLFSGTAPFCAQFDQGADPYEIAMQRAQWYLALKPINFFRRGRANWASRDTLTDMTQRVFNPLKRWNDWFNAVRHDTATDHPQTLDDWRSFAPLREASRVAFNFLVRVLALPPNGNHIVATDTAGTAGLIRPPESATGIGVSLEGDWKLVPAPLGHPYRSGVSAVGITDYIGAFQEKELALEALLDPTYWAFPGRETWEDADIFQVNFFSTFPDATMDIIGALVADDWSRLGPGYVEEDVDGETIVDLSYRDYTDLDSTVDGTVVRPTLGLNLRMRALAFALALIRDTYPDRRIISYARLAIDTPLPVDEDPLDFVEFTDPDTGRLYRARRFVRQGRDIGIASRLLDRCNNIAAILSGLPEGSEEWIEQQAALRREVGVLELARSIVLAFDEDYAGNTPDPAAGP